MSSLGLLLLTKLCSGGPDIDFSIKKKFVIGENYTDISCPAWFIYVLAKIVSDFVNVGVLKAVAVSGVCFKFKNNLKILYPSGFISEWRNLAYFWTFFYCPNEWFF